MKLISVLKILILWNWYFFFKSRILQWQKLKKENRETFFFRNRKFDFNFAKKIEKNFEKLFEKKNIIREAFFITQLKNRILLPKKYKKSCLHMAPFKLLCLHLTFFYYKIVNSKYILVNKNSRNFAYIWQYFFYFSTKL